MLHKLQIRALRAPLRVLPMLPDRGPVADYLQTLLAAERRAQFPVIFLDRANRLLDDEAMGQGTVDRAPA